MNGLPADVWVPVPIRFRHVQPGDMFVAHDGALWMVLALDTEHGSLVVSAVRADERHASSVDPDEAVTVLIPVTEAEAVELTREVLGARLVERRTEDAT